MLVVLDGTSVLILPLCLLPVFTDLFLEGWAVDNIYECQLGDVVPNRFDLRSAGSYVMK